MSHVYLNLILDLSLPVEEDPATIRRLSHGLTEALKILSADPRQRVEVALCGAITQALLRQGEDRPLQMLAETASRGQATFLSTAAFGAFLPLVPRIEAQRQLAINDRINRDGLGDTVYRPEGVFPPQLGYSRTIAEIAMAPGRTRRLIVDGLAYHGGHELPRNRTFRLSGQPRLSVFFCDRAASEAIDHGRIRDARELEQFVRRPPGYVIARIPGRLLLDGGPGLRLLASLSSQTQVRPASLVDLLGLFPEFEDVEPLACALGTDPTELAAGVPYAKWFAPGNELHAILWRLVQLVSEQASRATPSRNPLSPEYLLPRASRRLALAEPSPPALKLLRLRLDSALHSAAWRFASGKPEFDPDKVREGGLRLLEALRAGGDEVESEIRDEAEALYQRLDQRCTELAERARTRRPPPSVPAEAGAPA